MHEGSTNWMKIMEGWRDYHVDADVVFPLLGLMAGLRPVFWLQDVGMFLLGVSIL